MLLPFAILTASSLMPACYSLPEGIADVNESLPIEIFSQDNYEYIFERRGESQELNVMTDFAGKLLEKSEDIPLEFARVIQDNLFDLL